jgi:2-oxoglutarate dehydrogenase E1 component
VREILSRRSGSVKDNQPLDWGTAEAMAMGTLLNEGISVRITGQDVRRGTFSHRHAVLFDTKTNERYCPLSAICPPGTGFEIYDSLLSEAAVLGFEFGYSLDAPDWLVIWEAQFGDFVNGAQTIIDQFISASESKWRRDSGLVMLLPHGYEGQGPEHSSARLERFLQLCAENNMQVATPTTPSQIYHALRRQMKRNFRKPLIIMSPKSLLRHKAAVSSVAELVEGSFQEIIDDASAEPSKVKRVVLCSGKVYYDLNEEREKQKLADVAIVRVEQLYPLHMDRLETVIKRYKKSQQLIWAQEESQNMGAWFFMEPRLRASGLNPVFVGRDASASPATGVKKVHEREQKELVYQALCGNGMHVVGPIGRPLSPTESAATPRDKVSSRV